MAAADEESRPSLQRLLHDRIFAELASVRAKRKILILDAVTTRILSCISVASELNDMGFFLFETLSMPRQPLPDHTAVYFLQPWHETIVAMLADLSEETPKYKDASVIFCSPIPPLFMSTLAESKALPLITSLKELDCNYRALEENIFTLDMANCGPALTVLRNNPKIRKSPVYNNISDKLISLCMSLGEDPHVRYMKSSQAARVVAQMVRDGLVTGYATRPELLAQGRSRSTILILDRTVDLISPFIHDFGYQALVNDVLEVNEDRYVHKYSTKSRGEVEETVVLNVNPSFLKRRHMHVADVAQECSDELTAFAKQHSGLTKDASKSVGDIRSMLRELPQYTTQIRELSLHVDMSSACMTQFRAEQLERVAELEQDLAAGDSKGKAMSTSKLLTRLDELIGDESVSTENKLRLMIIFLASRGGLADAARAKHANIRNLLDRHDLVFSQLHEFGLPLRGDKDKSTYPTTPVNASEHEYDRYTSQVKHLLQRLVAGDLSRTDYPAAGEAAADGDASLSSEEGESSSSVRTKPKWTQKKKASAASGKASTPSRSASKDRLFVFVLGGMTYGEMRAAYEVSGRKHVIIGSTHILTPLGFLANMQEIVHADP